MKAADKRDRDVCKLYFSNEFAESYVRFYTAGELLDKKYGEAGTPLAPPKKSLQSRNYARIFVFIYILKIK